MTIIRALACVAAITGAAGCIQEPSLFVTLAGDGAGRVMSEPTGIDCGRTCGMVVDRGAMLSLIATPRAGSVFAGWRGGGCEDVAAGTPCSPELVEDTTITATFTLALRSLAIAKSGTGSGTVTSSPIGISCGGDCEETYSLGTSIELTATPAPESRFVGWLGEDECSATTPCSLIVDRDATIGAIFEPL